MILAEMVINQGQIIAAGPVESRHSRGHNVAFHGAGEFLVSSGFSGPEGYRDLLIQKQ